MKQGTRGYILGVHFQKCSNFSIFFTLNISTPFFTSQVGAAVANAHLNMPISRKTTIKQPEKKGKINHVFQGGVAVQLRCGGIAITNLLMSVPVIKL